MSAEGGPPTLTPAARARRGARTTRPPAAPRRDARVAVAARAAGASSTPAGAPTPDAALVARRLRPDDWPAVIALADRLLGFPFAQLIRVNRSHEGWALVDDDGRLVFVQLTRVEDLGEVRVGLLGWALAEPDVARRASGRALQRLFRAVHAALREAGCAHFVVGDIDGYCSPSWRLAHAGGYRRWTPTQQMRVFGWRWPSVFWRLSHFGVRTFMLHRPASFARPAAAAGGRGVMPAFGVVLALGTLLSPIIARGDAWRAGTWVACTSAVALHFAVRAAAQGFAARRRGLELEFRVWDSGLITAVLCGVAGVFVPGLAGAPYVRDERYDYLEDRRDFGGVRAVGVLAGLALGALACAALASGATASSFASATLLVGLGSGVTDTLPLGGPWSAGAVGAVRRRRPWLAWCCFAAWCALLVFAVAGVGG